MNANILIVTSEDFPNPLFVHLENSGYTCFYSRGVLKTRDVLKKEQIDAIVWLFMGHEIALGRDLAKVFNQYEKTPIVFITQTYEQLDFAEDIKAIFANHDLNDEIADITSTIETACNQSIIKDQIPISNDDPNEIEFKNAVSHIVSNPEKLKDGFPHSGKLSGVSLWEAVDKKEKSILAGNVSEEEKKSLFPKLKTLIKK